jgi:hypothetical protein
MNHSLLFVRGRAGQQSIPDICNIFLSSLRLSSFAGWPFDPPPLGDGNILVNFRQWPCIFMENFMEIVTVWLSITFAGPADPSLQEKEQQHPRSTPRWILVQIEATVEEGDPRKVETAISVKISKCSCLILGDKLFHWLKSKVEVKWKVKWR